MLLRSETWSGFLDHVAAITVNFIRELWSRLGQITIKLLCDTGEDQEGIYKKLKDNWRHITCVSVSFGTAYCPGSPLYTAFYWAHSFLYGCDDEKPLWAQVLTWGVFQLVMTNTTVCCDIEKQLCIWAQAQLDTEAMWCTKSHVIGKGRGEKTDVDQRGKMFNEQIVKKASVWGLKCRLKYFFTLVGICCFSLHLGITCSLV